MLTERHRDRLPGWMNDVQDNGAPALRSFANGLRNDLDAVTAGLTLPCSPAPSKAPSTESRRSSVRCTVAPDSTYYASESSTPHDKPRENRSRNVRQSQVSRPPLGRSQWPLTVFAGLGQTRVGYEIGGDLADHRAQQVPDSPWAHRNSSPWAVVRLALCDLRWVSKRSVRATGSWQWGQSPPSPTRVHGWSGLQSAHHCVP